MWYGDGCHVFMNSLSSWMPASVLVNDMILQATSTFCGLKKKQILIQFSSVAQSCPTLSKPMECSTPRLPVHHNSLSLLKHVSNWVSDAIQPSHPLSSPSPAVNLSQHQGLFTGVSSSIRWLKSKVLEFQLQHQWSWMNIQHPMNIQDWFPLGWTGWISLLSKGLSRIVSNTTLQNHQFFGPLLFL